LLRYGRLADVERFFGFPDMLLAVGELAQYSIRKMRKGESEPFYETLALNALGIDKLKAVKADA